MAESEISSASTAIEAMDENMPPSLAALKYLRRGDTTIRTFSDPEQRWFSKETSADIFEVIDGKGHRYSALNDDALRQHLERDAPAVRKARRLRIIFLDGDENDAERLPITGESMQLILDTYKIAPRFFFFLSRQQMADEVENQIATLNSPRDLFDKARSLTAVYRKIRQVLTDYEILLVSAKSMRKQNESIGKLLKLYADRHDNLQPSKELQHQLHLSFKQIRRELKLGKVYLTLYLERCNSGIADSHSVSTQHSAEIQIKTSKEFTQISRDSTEDNKSLRAIQVMTAIFLPPSLISSLFGMGFFNTEAEDDGKSSSGVGFAIARQWWWYLAVTLPVTLLVLALVCREWISWHPRKKRFVWKRRPSTEADLEGGLIKVG
ncbi:hypothetical protein LTR37_011127 [Vermiconidia calcicola]|uniref:Uncharacterized protein n=1 Tax=Vermiconidia calcicola TaxID=1690605 RepID=A0ACC3N2U9_9PEZI|nr:hypothetical protein LTR37_011127 [Vermiconidia calcicola]